MGYETLLRLHKKLKNVYDHTTNNNRLKWLSYDLNYYDFLVEIFGYTDLYLPIPYYINPNDLSFKVKNYLLHLEMVADTIIDMYKGIDYFNANSLGYSKLSKKDKDDILKEFLTAFCPPAYKIYEDLLKKGHIFEYQGGELGGEAFILTELDDALIGFDYDQCNNDLFYLEVIIHELMHIYSEFFLKNYRRSYITNTIDGFYNDVVPFYSELEFYNFMVQNHICVDSMQFHANNDDYMYLMFCKNVKYFVEMVRRPDADVYIDTTEYKVLGNIIYDKDKDKPVFSYPKSFCEGDFSCFVYCMSLIDAYKLLGKRLNGEKNIINNYLISLQNEHKFEDDAEAGYDLTLMRDNIKKHQDEIIKIYSRKNNKITLY